MQPKTINAKPGDRHPDKNKNKMKKVILILSIITGIFTTGQTFGQSKGFTYQQGDTTATRCTATTQKGTQCKMKALPGTTKCRVHSEDTPRCGYIKSDGKPCKMIVSKAGEHCWHHDGSSRTPEADSSAIFYPNKAQAEKPKK